MPDEIALLCRLVLAVVLVVSGVGKVADRAGTREGARALGVPEQWVPTVARLLPAAELLVALLLLPASTARAGAAGALGLLTAFTAVVAVNLARGRRPECHCFGRWGSSEISGRTVARNVLLAGLATAALVEAPPLLDTARGTASAVGLAVAAAAAAVALVAADGAAGRAATGRRQQATDRRFDDDLLALTTDRGPAPRFVLPPLAGDDVALDDLLDGRRPLLLVFLSPGCGSCRKLRPVVDRWHDVFRDSLRIVVVASGSGEANAAAYPSATVPVLVDEDRSVAAEYGVPSRPAGALVDHRGHLLGPLATGDRNLRALVDAVLSGRLDRDGPLEESTVESLSLASAPAPRRSVTSAPAADGLDVVLTDEVGGASVALDPLGWLVWQCLDGQASLQTIADELAVAYGAPPAVVAEDVLRLVRHVARLGLLEGVAASPDAEDVPAAHPSPDVVPA